jgi:hypothetical protein
VRLFKWLGGFGRKKQKNPTVTAAGATHPSSVSIKLPLTVKEMTAHLQEAGAKGRITTAELKWVATWADPKQMVELLGTMMPFLTKEQKEE